MNQPYKLKANNGAEFSWGNREFSINDILFKEYKDKLRYSDCTEKEGWGDDGDFSYGGIKDAIMYNIGIMIKHYPETKEQFIEYVTNYPRKGEYDS